MYIKQIIIQGFKSYKDQTVIEPFSPHSNVIVGRNGSGKSNFFAAIRFVLSDAYTQMGRDERQALLHEGSGSAVMSAYVEVIFDNSEERFPTGKPETIIRRTIGLKKDEYSLDRKNATKSDVMNLLESAGFSRSNPYYIVPQGRVTTLTNMKDSERLNLLKEVAGTQVYEQRRSESLKIMDETTAKRQKIDELLKYIEERLEELEEEKEELRGFQEKDRERRCLEYTIYSREQREIAAALDQIEDSRTRGVELSEEAREQIVEREKEIKAIGQEIKMTRNHIDLQKAEKSQMDEELRDYAKTRAQLELAVTSLTEDQDQLLSAKSNFEKELKRLTQQIEEKEEELNQITPIFQQKKAEETRIRNEIQEVEATRARLHAKQGRTAQFKTKKERDVFLNKEIQETTANGQKTEALQANLQKEIAILESNSQNLEAGIQEMRERLGSRNERIAAAAEQVSSLKDDRARLNDERKELWREEARIQSNLSAAKEENDKAQRELSNSMDQNTRRGLEAMRSIKQRLGLAGVYGTVGELMEVEDRYRTAVEVTAGNALFHVVVDNDDTATELLDVLHREKLGRVTCMPLNRLKNRPTNFPETNDAIPMIRKVKFDKRYNEAFEHIFGKTIICPDITIASQYARSHGVSAITLAGDRSDKRGALTGGYYDSRRSRLEAIKNSKKWAEEYEGLKQEAEKVRIEIERKGQEITQVNSEVQKAEAALQQIEESFAPLRHQILSKTAALGATNDNLEQKRTILENVTTRISELAKQLQAYQNELRSDFKKSLSSEEESLLQQLSTQLSDLQKQQSVIVPEASRLAGEKTILEETLRKNLYPRLDELKAYAGDQPEGEKGNLKEQQKELKRIVKKIDSIQKRLSQTEGDIEKLSAELSELESRKSELEGAQEEAKLDIQKQQKRMEKNIAKKALLSENAAETSRNIRDLGVLPEEAFSKYEKVPSQTIMKRLHKVNDALKKFSHVNKKAVEQYNNFTKQRDTLTKRREELDKSQSSIEDLISVLDQRKDEAIERTFRQVSKSFAEIFEKLVPAGRGRLVIQRKMDKRTNDDDESEDEESRNSVENYTGVGITVSFNSKHDEQQKIQQLSGGQKSLCALGLIFAIQNCDPAPFYLFDEVDANLDSQYRSAVAQMIKENSAKDCQYICTTFRPELILTADKHYGVTYTNKTSSVGLVTQEEALRFVEGETRN